MTYQVKKITHAVKGTNWYNFEDIPQGYIRVANLICGSDRKALNRAKKWCTDQTATIELVKVFK